MERLQVAIEKARAQRLAEAAERRAEKRQDAESQAEAASGEATAALAGTVPARPRPEGGAPRRAAAAEPAPEAPRRPAPRAARPAGDSAELRAAWAGLRPFEEGRTPRRPGLVAAGEGPSAAAAAYNLLRTRMLQQARRNGWRRIAIVSPDSGDGKTTVAANLAVGMSRQFDTRSAVIDLDLRRIGLSRFLRPRDLDRGMEAVLSGEVSFRRHAYRLGDNVALGLNANPVADASEILQSAAAAEMLGRIEAELAPDVMIFDMPPLQVGEDNFGFLENVDCALIIAAAERTPMSRIDAAERQVAELTEVMGIVLNKCRYPDKTYAYEY